MSVNSFLFLPCVKPTSSANFALACSKLLIIFPLVSPLTHKALISPTVASTFVGSKTPVDRSPSNNNSFNFL